MRINLGIMYINVSTAPRDCPADIVFVMDESGSIGTTNFELMKSFLSRLVSRLDIDSGNTRVGLVTFSDGVGTSISLNAHSSVASLQRAISSLRYSYGRTFTHAALAHVHTRMLTSAAGDRSNVPNVVVVVTDGASNNPTATQVKKLLYFIRYTMDSKIYDLTDKLERIVLKA